MSQVGPTVIFVLRPPIPSLIPIHVPIAIDRTPYTSAPRIGMASGATLIEQLIDVAKGEESPTIADSVKKLRKTLANARATHVQAGRASATPTAAGDLVLDATADRCLKALKLRLDAWPLIDTGERAQRATRHLALLFPRGLQPTQATFAVQDAEMRRISTELKDGELADSLDELVGPEFIAAFKKVAKAYSAMVKAMGRVVDSGVDQRTVVIAMQTVIVQHASRVLGELEDDEPGSVERVRRLLAPIDNFRARAGQGGGSGDGEGEGEDVGERTEDEAGRGS